MAPAAPAPITLYRIGADTPSYGADDRSGAGTRKTGGRWNRPDTAVLYTASTRALTCLETLIHLAPTGSFPFHRYLVEFLVPPASWARRTVFDPVAHVGWDALPAGWVSLDWGTAWIQGGATLVAEVPSVIVPEETNCLLNPAHPEMAAVIVRKIRRWHYDPRLASGGGR